MVREVRSGACLPLSPLVDACLAAFDGGCTIAAALPKLSAWPRAAVSGVVAVLVELGVLVKVRPHQDGWRRWEPVAEWFHFGTRDVPVTRRPPPRTRPPSPVLKRSSLASVSLPLPQLTADLQQALAERRTWRRLSDRPLAIDHVGTLLGITFGIQAWADAASAGWSALKTSPSGGARHSLEAYVCVRRVQGVPAGLYHYRPDHHRLDLLRRGCTVRDVGGFLPGQDGYRRTPLLVVMASVLARVTWRYSHARAYRVILMESGHLAQTFALVATGLGLASFSTGALADTRLEDAFTLTPETSPVVYAVGAGHRPADTDWAPYAQAPAPRLRTTRLGRSLSNPR